MAVSTASVSKSTSTFVKRGSRTPCALMNMLRRRSRRVLSSEPHLVASAALGLVELRVRALHELVWVLDARVPLGDPEADRHGNDRRRS